MIKQYVTDNHKQRNLLPNATDDCRTSTVATCFIIMSKRSLSASLSVFRENIT